MLRLPHRAARALSLDIAPLRPSEICRNATPRVERFGIYPFVSSRFGLGSGFARAIRFRFSSNTASSSLAPASRAASMKRIQIRKTSAVPACRSPGQCAERKAGELDKTREKAKAGHPPAIGSGVEPIDRGAPTPRDLGISKRHSDARRRRAARHLFGRRRARLSLDEMPVAWLMSCRCRPRPTPPTPPLAASRSVIALGRARAAGSELPAPVGRAPRAGLAAAPRRAPSLRAKPPEGINPCS